MKATLSLALVVILSTVAISNSICFAEHIYMKNNNAVCMDGVDEIDGDVEFEPCRFAAADQPTKDWILEEGVGEYKVIKNGKTGTCISQVNQGKSEVVLASCNRSKPGNLWRIYNDKQFGTKLISKWGDMRKDGKYDCLARPDAQNIVAVRICNRGDEDQYFSIQ
ncbi:hypothetical protein BDF22DRAFT_655114 [Syncephalis plumigaleata]|nr:hypothetical protein BDF22DRAFT_655114 [Syncephalis plumigaleata]